VQNPVYSYPVEGNYTITLTISTVQCPQTKTVKQFDVRIDAPATGIRYPDKEAIMNFPEPLEARRIGNSVLWEPPVSLDFSKSFTPNFKGIDPQLYRIRIKTATGCLTTDTLYVKTRKKIDIYVPTAFTPDGNGRNEYLRPYLHSFKKVNFFRVYNRWGKLLFQMQNDTPGWDGRVNGVVQEMQTVIWMIEAVDVDGVTHKRQGTSILIR
jgi:gliding motility-associated-like protein